MAIKSRFMMINDPNEFHMAGESGIYQLWYNEKNRTAYEIFDDDLDERLIVRRVWYGIEPEYTFDGDHEEAIINDFYYYLQKGEFQQVLNDEGFIQSTHLN